MGELRILSPTAGPGYEFPEEETNEFGKKP
jgi:hypothetical protein